MALVGALVASLWAPRKRDGDGEYEIVCYPGLELFPSSQCVKVANSIEELHDSKTWVLIHRGEDDCTLAWSPCDGERALIPEQLIGSGGLCLASGFCHDVGPTSLLLNAHQDLVIADKRNHALYFSSTNSWQPLLDADEEEEDEFMDAQEVREIGNTYIHSVGYNPQNGSYRCLPQVGDVEPLGLHWHGGSFYFMSYKPLEDFELFRWQGGEQEWQKVASHPIYQDGVQRLGGDLFWLTAGGRYVCIFQGNMSYPLEDSGRFIVVYDLEERQWHYHTMHADLKFSIPNVLVGNRGAGIGASAFNAMWHKDLLHLQLPPISCA